MGIHTERTPWGGGEEGGPGGVRCGLRHHLFLSEGFPRDPEDREICTAVLSILALLQLWALPDTTLTSCAPSWPGCTRSGPPPTHQPCSPGSTHGEVRSPSSWPPSSCPSKPLSSRTTASAPLAHQSPHWWSHGLSIGGSVSPPRFLSLGHASLHQW